MPDARNRPRLTPKQFAARRDKIRTQLDAGVPAAEIAKNVGLSHAWLLKIIRNDHTLELRRSPNGMAYRVGRIGRTADALANEREAFREWVRDNLPEGSTVAEFLVSCAVDAWIEETQGQDHTARTTTTN